jgi:hypothetical protein
VAEVIFAQHGNALVFRGSFNPRILQPAWLAAQGLIREAESENAAIQIVHEQVVAFGLDWMNLEVRHDQLTVNSTPTSETPEQIRDLALGVIEILEHTPIHGVGLQFFGHYGLTDQAARDELQRKLVPQAPFEELLSGIGMRTLTMFGRREEGDEGLNGVSVTVEPSATVEPNGVYVGVFDQYDFADPDDANLSSAPAVEVVKLRWQESSRRAEAIIAEILATT